MQKINIAHYLRRQVLIISLGLFILTFLTILMSNYYVFNWSLNYEREERADMFVQLVREPYLQGSELEVRSRMLRAKKNGRLICSEITGSETLSDCREEDFKKGQVLTRNIYFDPTTQSVAASLRLVFPKISVWENALSSVIISSLIMFVFFILGLFLSRHFVNRLEGEFKTLKDSFQLDPKSPGAHSFFIQEMDDLQRELNEVLTHKKMLAERVARGQLARQVAHDIRSPLSALQVLLSHPVDNLSEHQSSLHMIAKRISDIAHQLLGQNTQTQTQLFFASEMVERIVAEKRFQWSDRVNFVTLIAPAAQHVFLNCSQVEFGRSLSNIIDNAVEASTPQSNVSIELSLPQGRLQLLVRDSGRGLSLKERELLEVSGGSFHKAHGLGLGLKTVKDFVKSAKGEFIFDSLENVGSSVGFILPMAASPDWFLGQVLRIPTKKVIVVDDDEGLRSFWNHRLKLQGIQVETYPNFEGVTHDPEAFLICDYELANCSYNGLARALELGWTGFVVLTSHHDRTDIQEIVSKSKLKLFPKFLLHTLQVDVMSGPSKRWILVEDDKLVQTMWKLEARQMGVNLVIQDFPSENLLSEDKETYFFVDQYFNGENLGQQFAQDLIKNGFKNIWFCTGSSPDEMSSVSGVRGVLGKAFPRHLVLNK